MKYPTLPIGDGDGLPFSKVEKIFGFLEDEQAVVNDATIQSLWSPYVPYFGDQESPNLEGVELRCRLIGYDTQETPKPGDSSLNVVQHFWKNGKDFLIDELNQLKGGRSPEVCKLLVDAYGIDVYHRLLIDVRGVFEVYQQDLEPQLHRFELAEKALGSGFAFPTANYFTNENLMESFHHAIETKQGGFADGAASFIHPLLCRKERYKRELNVRHQRRKRFKE